MSRSLIRGKIHSCLCYDERRENSPIIKIIDEFNMKKNNLENIYSALVKEQPEIQLDADLMKKALLPIERMLEIK